MSIDVYALSPEELAELATNIKARQHEMQHPAVSKRARKDLMPHVYDRVLSGSSLEDAAAYVAGEVRKALIEWESDPENDDASQKRANAAKKLAGEPVPAKSRKSAN
jgi:hypothetical protein